MITGAIKSQIARIWDAFWSGGISNPLEAIEQIGSPLFGAAMSEVLFRTLAAFRANAAAA